MPVGTRIRRNSIFGSVLDSPLAIGALTFNSSELVLVPAITGNHFVITLDPLRQYGEPEIVIITSHTASATVATITRAAYGTVARAHPAGTKWVHAPVVEDITPIVTSSTRPSDPYEGQMIYETDTDTYRAYDGAAWSYVYGGRIGWHLQRAANQTISPDADTAISYDTENVDTPGNFTAPGTTLTIPTGGAGLWVITLSVDAQALPAALQIARARIIAGGITFAHVDQDDVGSAIPQITITVVVPLIVGNTISTDFRHSASGSLDIKARLLAYKILN